MNRKNKIVLLGSGNVAEHLLRAFNKSVNSEVIQLYSRNIETGKELSKKCNVDYTNNLKNLKDADLYLISINDSAISKFSKSLPFENRLVAHTSGATDINTIDYKNRPSVFYPLQSFTKGKKIDFSNIPICLEAKSTTDYNKLFNIAESISNTVRRVSSEERKYLHVSAVFVNNFTNHLFHIGKEIADFHSVDFNLLKPLIKETVDKLQQKSPKDAQTGPAIRGDQSTMNKHLNMIPKEKYKDIYKLITESIFDTYN